MTDIPSATAVHVGASVRAEMARKGVRQAQVAAKLGRSQAAVSARLSGQVDFSVSDLVQVASLLEISADELLRGASA